MNKYAETSTADYEKLSRKERNREYRQVVIMEFLGYGTLVISGLSLVIALAALVSTLSGKKGSLLVFQIYENGNVKDWKTAVVDGVTILEDTYYILDGSEIVKAGEVIV